MELFNPRKIRIIIKSFGILFVSLGLLFLMIAPLEIHCFYLFSEGGRFHYHGFGIGSLLFGLLYSQILAYYFIGIILISIGYGHLKLKSWALALTKGSIWFWIIFALPICLFFLPLLFTKEIEIKYPLFFTGLVFLVIIIIIPGLLLAFYKQKNVVQCFNNSTINNSVISKFPISGWLLLLVYILYIMIFQIALIFHGIFPFFGILLFKIIGSFLLSLSVLVMLLSIYGLLKKIYWLWIFSFFYFLLLSISVIITLINNQYITIIELMNFPKYEADILNNLPLKSSYILIIVIGLLVVTFLILIKARSHFKNKNTPYNKPSPGPGRVKDSK